MSLSWSSTFFHNPLHICITFDSCGKLNNGGKIYEWKTEYGHSAKHTIRYDNGVTLDHVMASATIPITYDYQEINGRRFWDGGVLSNTPLRELIGRHKDFWKNEIGEEKLKESGKQVRRQQIMIKSQT